MPSLLIILLLSGQQGGSTPPAADVARQVQSLGAQKFSERQAASRKLRELGPVAVPELRKAATGGNPEVRDRAGRILSGILGSDVRDAFLAKPSLETAKKIPGWDRVRSLCGSDEVALKTLNRWLTAEPRLFEARVMGDRELALEMKTRAARLSDFSRGDANQSALDSVHALLFVATDANTKLNRDAANTVASVLELTITQRALVPESGNAITRKLTGQWVQRDGDQYQKLILTLKFGLPEGLALAEKIIRGKARGARMEYALHVIGRVGGREQIPLLRQQLDNRTRLSSPRSNAVRQPGGRRSQSPYEYQVRDIALAMLWHLHGENPAEHGFDRKRIGPHRWFVYRLGSMGFSSETDRDAAFAEWTAFEARNREPR